MFEIPAAEAWQNVTSRNQLARWKTVVDRARQQWVMAAGDSRLRIAADEPIFCIGSCFAKNIEARLLELGFNIQSRPGDPEAGAPPAVALPNLYNICSIVNELRWGLSDVAPRPEASFVADDDGLLFDPHSNRGLFRGTPAEIGGRRQAVTRTMRRIEGSRVVIMTLGLVEVWFDSQTDLYLNSSLPRFLLEREPGRYCLRVLDYHDLLTGLHEAADLIDRHAAEGVKIVLTVSPVPLAATFTIDDVLVANAYSKSTQLAAARDFARQRSNVHYVASYESVMHSPATASWEEDRRHPTRDVVDAVVTNFVANHVGPASGSHPQDRRAGRTPGRIEPPSFAMATPGDRHFPAGFPRVTASSTLAPQYGAAGLMSPGRGIWHSQVNPTFPEWLLFEFTERLTVRRLFLRSQHLCPERGPGEFTLDARVNGSWRRLLHVTQAEWRVGGEWLDWPIAEVVPATEFRIVIYSSAGAAEVVTLQKAYLSPIA
jgi:hypothetical protein